MIKGFNDFLMKIGDQKLPFRVPPL